VDPRDHLKFSAPHRRLLTKNAVRRLGVENHRAVMCPLLNNFKLTAAFDLSLKRNRF
jgi:hypothetical protein